MDGTIGFALLFCVGTNYHFLLSNRLLSRRLHSKAEVEMSDFHSFCDPPNHTKFLQGPMRSESEKQKKEGGKGKLECPIYRGKKIETLVV